MLNLLRLTPNPHGVRQRMTHGFYNIPYMYVHWHWMGLKPILLSQRHTELSVNISFTFPFAGVTPIFGVL